MPLSWNEMKTRAVAFSKEWEHEERERAESQTFWNEFFNIFGISRRRVATFEKPVKKFDDKQGFIDLLWKGVILVEHKSRGESLDTAYTQAKDYFPGLKEKELPRYILVSDFANFRLYDLEDDKRTEFELKDLYLNVNLFDFIAGYQKRTFKEEDPVNIEAAELMGKLHDKLLEIGYEGHELELYLVRLLFCMFADDTSIFERNLFLDYIVIKTNEDGSDLAHHLSTLFHVLNTPENKRLTNLDESLNAFPYINGKLFEEVLSPASFDSSMRKILIDCCLLDWGKISPAIFGSLFQSVMDPEKRRNLGAHYTSEKNILKLIKPLFLDDLWHEFKKVKNNRRKLNEFHKKISNLKFFDPACGCGNFLVITYREIRILELEITRILLTDTEGFRQQLMNIENVLKVDVDSFYGIEVEEFPARIAEVSMWMMDHQMNMRVSEQFGIYFTRLPLQKGANITVGNALKLKWEKIVPKDHLTYMIGNPPYAGKQKQDESQKKDMKLIFKGIKGYGVLDYVTAWYIKAAQYIQKSDIKVAFVSTNSISQGEQVGILWNELFNEYGIKIHFAHRTFKWSNEAKNAAAVFVVIIGFATFDTNKKLIFEYNNPKSEAHEIKVNNINPYLIEGSDIVILKRKIPLCDVPKISFGSMPNDGGNLLLSDDEKNELLKKEPNAAKFVRPLISGREFINGISRWCLWLVDAKPNELKQMPEVSKRIKLVKEHRMKSRRKATQKLADFPTLFGEIRHPETDYLAIPLNSSGNRRFIPMGFLDKNNIANNSCSVIKGSSLYHFGVMMSTMHMTWVNYVGGRIKGDYRYSNEIIYNNFPWPDNSSKNKIQNVKVKADKVLTVRQQFSKDSLADLYDPLMMPPKLVKAHMELDRAVDLCYRKNPFVNDVNRMEFLLDLYQNYEK
ncbi:class I SAM-dependent DNA methyltransferase [Methanobacterium sp. CWC-01]|uniref:class I SAM-dependent DNA methyltransferase n=1 Tax=Methanobacterium aridiramus TaxID=2584467 RepID=UPI002576F9B7|nr:DNA methyltransferase [Methanobacterium sp. CWC-01]WJI09505.1 class I SAM-dependent DNA methyltransferase [Methanobacterium sp. CWC-01]